MASIDHGTVPEVCYRSVFNGGSDYRAIHGGGLYELHAPLIRTIARKLIGRWLTVAEFLIEITRDGC